MSRSTYKYSPVDLTTDAIRLVRLLSGHPTNPIECQIFQTYLHDVDGIPYEALSYSWGDITMPAEIILDGCVLQVTGNLYEALRHLRLPEQDRLLWIDAICIDQRNSKERGHQVSQMQKIYANAENVLIWLGLGSLEMDFLIESMSQVHQRARALGEDWKKSPDYWHIARPILRLGLGGSYATLDSRLEAGLQQLFAKRWFLRVWVIQEVASARTATIVCGWKSVSTWTFTQAPSLLGVQPDSHIQAILDVMPGYLRKSTWWSQSRDLGTLIRKFSESHATDPRDKIYALLAISSNASDAKLYYPSYEKALTEVIQDAVSFFLFGKPTDRLVYDLPKWTFQQLVENLADLEELPYEILRWALQEKRKNTAEKILTNIPIDMRKQLFPLEPEREGRIAMRVPDKSDLGTIWGFLYLKQRETQFIKGHGMPEAAKENMSDKVQYLLEKGAEVDTPDDSGRTPLSWAAEGSMKELIVLLYNSANVHARDYKGWAPLFLAQQLEIISLLLRKGANIDARDNHGRTPLSYAAAGIASRATKVLLDNGAQIESTDNTGRTPLSWAAEGGIEALEDLLDNGANVHACDHKGWTPLFRAKQPEIIRLLLRKGADIETRDSHGRTPFSYAALVMSRATKTLFENGAQIESRDNTGRTPLSWAAQGEVSYITTLLEAGADLTTCDDDGRTPLSWAAGSGINFNVWRLVKQTSDINTRDNDGLTPLAWATRNGHGRIIQMLFEAGTSMETNIETKAEGREEGGGQRGINAHWVRAGRDKRS